MANIKIETKNHLDIGKKTRVYFTCHPDDFEKCFKKICDDIFKTHDCAIYYTEDMCEAIAEDEKETDLGRNNLFVIPVTFKLLTTPNRAMDEDFRYAMEKHIPVLPIMMESGLDELYSKPDKFGELQYLNPYSTDPTEISYKEKLKKHLEAILISDEMAKRVRAAFDAYIFLSYRKKDRKYANQLMKLIHSNPDCRDIAIWFDEFLTPGESFKEGIDKILHNSQLFTLLVTPNILEEPNFVMGEEYPAAQKSGINILPAEMVETDKNALKEKYRDIPECVKPEDKEFYTQLLDSVTKIATQANNTPEHNFLIGLAYLDGIDVEVNREFALELITSAAEAGLPEAMEKLRDIYSNGVGVHTDYKKALIWGEKYADYMVENYGEEDRQTISALNSVAVIYVPLGEYEKSLEISQKAYKNLCNTVGEDAPEANTTLGMIAGNYMVLKDFDNALKLSTKAYDNNLKSFGEESPVTITSSLLLSQVLISMDENEKALEMSEKAYSLSLKVMGEEDAVTLVTLQNLSLVYRRLGDFEKAVESYEKIYSIKCNLYGEEHPDTFQAADNLIYGYADAGEFEKAEELNSKLYAYRVDDVGKKNAMLRSFYNTIQIDALKDIKNDTKTKEIEAAENEYNQKCAELGEEHPETLDALKNLGCTYNKYISCHEQALTALCKLYTIQYKLLGETHNDTLATLSHIAYTYSYLENYEKALELAENLYTTKLNLFGRYSTETISALQSVAEFYGKVGNSEKEAELMKEYKTFFHYKNQLREELYKARQRNKYFTDVFANDDFSEKVDTLEAEYTKRCNTLGEEHIDTLATLSELACVQTQWSDFRDSTESNNSLFYTSSIKPEYLLNALELNKKAYELMCKVLGEDHPDTLKQLSSLAYTYNLLGERDEDIKLQENLCELCCKVLGLKHPDTIIALANVVYSCDARNDRELAHYNSSSMDYCEMKKRQYIPATAFTYFGSGTIYGHETILENKKKLYNIFSELLGEENSETIKVKNSLALEYATNRQYKNASELYESLYINSCKNNGETHPDTLEISSCVAYSQMREKNYEKGIDMLEKIYQVQCEVLGFSDYASKRTLNMLKQAYVLSGKSESFDAAKEEVYRLQCSVFGEYHINTFDTIKELINLYREKNDYKNEVKYQEKLYITYCKTYGEENKSCLLLRTIARLYYKNLGDYQKAIENLEKSYTLCCIVYGEEDRETLVTLKDLAYCYCNLKNMTKSITLHENAYKLYCKVFGEEHPDTLAVLHGLAYCYGESGDRKKEIELYESLYPVSCKVLGEEHVNTLTTLGNLAYCYKECGDLKKALELYEKVYRGRVKVLGEDHKSTIQTAERIEEIKKLLEK